MNRNQIDTTSSSTRAPNNPSLSSSSYRQIRAIYDEDTIRVYQAYNDQIAKLAAEANSFQAPLNAGVWSDRRMTWIKPSKVWMAYRCGWTVLKNDKNQTRVLALDLSRRKLEELLMKAQLSSSHSDGKNNSKDDNSSNSNHDEDCGRSSHGKINNERRCRNSHVVVQWDPERIITTSANDKKKNVFTKPLQDVRSIQIGLRGDGVKALLDPTFVLKITDVTKDFQHALSVLQKCNVRGGEQGEDSKKLVLEAVKNALWPDGEYEEVMNISLELSNVLDMMN